MEKITVLKRFIRNAAIMSVVAGVMFGLIHYSEVILGNPIYPIVTLFSAALIWLLWGISVSQLESEAREQRDKAASAQRTMLTE